MRYAHTFILMLVLTGLALAAAPANAHDFRLVRIGVVPQDGGLLVDVKLPSNMELQAPAPGDGCRAEVARSPRDRERATYAAWNIACREGRLPERLYWPWKLDGALVIRTLPDGKTTEQHLSSDPDGLTVVIGEAEQGGVFLHYFQTGVHHILSGLDHLALVACLCFLASGWHLVKLVTAFTLGHSITLALGALGYVSVPVAPLEALVALSIAILAREVLLGRREHGYGLATAFGLLHGLAFASELSALSPAQIVPALLAFNLGVEAGQLVFVGAILAFFAALSAMQIKTAMLGRGAAAAIGSFAIFWSIERVAVIVA